MMFGEFAFLLASFVVGAPAAAAGSGSDGSVSMSGNAPHVCSFQSSPRQITGTNMSLDGPSISSSQINVTQLIDENTARLKSASIQIELSGTCNGWHNLSLKTVGGGLSSPGQVSAVGGAFLTHINYRAEMQWAGQTVVLQTDATPGKKSPIGLVSGAYQGSLTIRLVIDGTLNNMTLPTANGVYSDLLIFQIGQPL